MEELQETLENRVMRKGERVNSADGIWFCMESKSPETT